MIPYLGIGYTIMILGGIIAILRINIVIWGLLHVVKNTVSKTLENRRSRKEWLKHI